MKNSLAKQRGLSLIELMIALLLSALLLLGVLQIFDSNRSAIQMQTAFARVQESGRFAVEQLAGDIRIASYWGCTADPASIENHLSTIPASSPLKGLYEEIGTKGVQGGDNSSGEKIGGIDVLDGTDTLTLRGAQEACVGLGRIASSESAGSSMQLSGQCDLEPGDVVLLSSCQGADLLSITNVPGKGGCNSNGNSNSNTGDDKFTANKGQQCEFPNASGNNLKDDYPVDTRILKPFERTYFLANSTVTGRPSLYLADTGASPMELVSGVDDMQILYGLDTDDNQVVDIWSSSENLDDAKMKNVLSVRVQLLISSDGSVQADELMVTDLDDETTTYTDGKLRKVYVTTTKIRNRGSL
ncbi:hypothetical protein Maes01_01622 [Microbulbifer aestuariivivens]|uniref:Prepilin-type N-terminal cleavage/methylation domain-containing protein n=1 Tax=Microbulbifer aestuariivivens TaxID=1908308 RepID=A0ABP9WPD4_9GAMM